MKKFGYIGLCLFCITLVVACSNNINSTDTKTDSKKSETQNINGKSYGAYIAGRVAHLRKDFNKASDYYIQALNSDSKNPELVGRLYLLLASKGRVAEAAKYANISIKNGDKNNFTYIIIAVEQMKKGQFEESNQTISQMEGVIYKEFITPLMSAWSYAGLGQKQKALDALKIMQKEPSFKALYHFHAGMINDYFDDSTNAQKHYEVIVNDETMEMSFRALQVISNFYIRTNQKDKALDLVKKYNEEKVLGDMLNKLSEKNTIATSNTDKIINDPNIGMSEALFSIAATLRQGPTGIDLAHMFISMSIYANPKYDLAKLLLADILENREMYKEAIDVYDTIGQDSEAYETVQIKKANNYVMINDYSSAELLLKTIAVENPQNYQLFLDLGDVLRAKNKQNEAIKYYEQALKKIQKIDNQHWVLYYALGISYERIGDWKQAEKNFNRALELSQNHYLVLNYLGYSWIKQGQNIEQAFSMIVDAYNQAPQDGNITDSLGWALYKLGYYNEAIKYLEKASEIEPSNAVISDHLGDAYWLGNRQNEAKFQWQHSLTMKDDSGELNIKDVNKKIKTGLSIEKTGSFNKENIEEKIKSITTD